ncbi:sensor histidine kinase [Streptomyces sp. DH37]|uniref:sensor histidine kinase n=1 Tax=Streptomyces sp. DH37 TaxID=3040122 RepID=UPI002443318A|nr:sensor histidine kinase [Streptomyces sp. DH37]MDG9702779.1 sensor histidine kinase [Streptomyces sp. DH37]
MARVGRARGDVVGRIGRGLRAVPRALREDLLTTAAEPLPRTGRPGWADWTPALAVPVVLLAVFLLVVNADDYAHVHRMSAPLGLLLAGVQSAALVGAMLRPVPAWWASTAAMVVVAWYANPHPAGRELPWTAAGLTLQAGVLFLVALRARPRVAAETLAVGALAGLAVGGPLPAREGNTGAALVTLVIAVVVGAALRGRRVARSRLAEQEELTAGERARRTLLEERHRIARELHDVVAHHMSVISIQAQVAPHLVENPSGELRENLDGIRRNALEALTELRRVLGVLRSEEAPSGSARYAPQPTLARLDELLGNVRGAGIDVTARTTGEPRPLPPGVELSAFRIVQEALSNAMRHAPGAAVRVEVGYRPGGLAVRVVNTAPQGRVRGVRAARPEGPARGGGHGLPGMRERAAMLGGDLAAGPTPDGGYEVTAVLPAGTPAPDPATPEEAP